MLQKFDRWLIDKAYQSVVNWSQRMPAWWVEQCAFLLMISSIMRFVFRPTSGIGDYFLLFIDLVVSMMFLWFSKMPGQLIEIAMDKGIRLFILIISLLSLFIDSLVIVDHLATGEPFHRQAIGIVYSLTFISVYYFAACKPPPPPVTKTKLAYT